jgi:hypothetical protein
MQYKLFVEWTNAKFVFDSPERQPVGDLHQLLNNGEAENALNAACDSFFSRIERRDSTDISMLVTDMNTRDLEAETIVVTDLWLSGDDTLVASLKASYTVELADEWTSGAQVSEWIQAHRQVFDCFVPYLLISGADYNALCEAYYCEECGVTASPA